ncbi:uncharacterized protein P174DRAFT_508315 [Aspergillus novofumigatus IBT 16806]|uniref:DUF6891 domain-containing protein n=1 Tax=Aspergillus novofumigatus (strain IBT 16806) TaxID=1392255 RepID=A0A2I1CJX6_ASPN1|nr:uncharacterized protein P174DRAFT_508315 [Aspergillus novofumigatus IBT 16806]PKX97932.1 hypothetical protein P174DRAFT_508315 [Aspergillus novofumigatus IBT 16806]
MDASNINDITQDARLQVLTGLYSQAEILQQLIDIYELPEHSTNVVQQLIQSLWNQQLEEETSWSDEPTDVEKLQTAFSRLEDEDRIICRMNFTCCQTCGNAEIGGEADETHIGQGRGLSLRYGDLEGDSKDESVVDIGQKIAARLREEGLNVDWNENPKKTIELDPFQWRVRLGRS